MRHDPASAAIVIMLRSLKMFGMAQAVTDLMEQGAPAFDAAVPMLAQLLKAELAEREVRSIAYHMKAARFPAYKDLSGFTFADSEINEAMVRQLHRGEFLEDAHNVVLIGGPGTGKTELLSVRTANILAKTDTLPENILCLTFTESGQAAMRERLVGIIGKDAYKVAIHTFHSFGSEVINMFNDVSSTSVSAMQG